MRVSDLVVAIDEIVAVEPTVVADEVEDGLACGGEAAAGEVGLVVGGGVDRRGGFFLPDLGAPVADGEEEFGLFAVPFFIRMLYSSNLKSVFLDN